jgi:hypothetical protein
VFLQKLLERMRLVGRAHEYIKLERSRGQGHSAVTAAESEHDTADETCAGKPQEVPPVGRSASARLRSMRHRFTGGNG